MAGKEIMKKIFSLLVKSNIAKNFLSLSAAEIFARIISLITFAYLARVLTPNGFGISVWMTTVREKLLRMKNRAAGM